MKIKRYKTARRHLRFYKNLFGFRLPNLVILDGTFTQMALKHQTQIEEQLPRYLNGPVQFLTSLCAVKEAEALGSKLYGAATILRRYKPLYCAHRMAPVGAADCIKTLLGSENAHHYFIATQDPELTEHVRTIPGVPLVYLHKNAMVLEKPSPISVTYSQKQAKKKTAPSRHEAETLKMLKGPEEEKIETVHRKRPKEPNSLSVRKKKMDGVRTEAAVGKGRTRSRRRRGIAMQDADSGKHERL